MKKKISALTADEHGNIFDVPFKNFYVIAAFKLKKLVIAHEEKNLGVDG